MSRFALILIAILGAVAAVADDGVPGAFHQEARMEAEQDGAGLVDESDRLREGERHFLAPLSTFEMTQLFEDDGSKPGVPKIGIVRHLPVPMRVARAELDRSLNVVGPSTFAGGRLTKTEDGRAIWTTSVSSPGAESLRLRFDNLVLPDGARVYVYGIENERYGPYTREFVETVTKGVHPFWTHTIQGPVAYVELQLDDPIADVELSIDGVGHFESASPEELVASPEGTECFRDISCAPDNGDLVAALSTATAQLRYSDGGSFYVCTGALVNVSATEEFEPYLLSANHCFDSQASASSLEAWWDYRSSTCDGSTPNKATLPKVVGSTLLASDPTSDFTFVRMTSNPAGSPHANGSRFYLGWTASKPTAETTIYRASHPNGGAQVWSRTISVDLPSSQTCSSLPQTRFIYSVGAYGGTTGGSSGASGTNANGQIIGQNYGKCGSDLSDPCNYSGANTVDGAFATTFPYIETWLKPVVETAPCALDDATICLQSNRFEVQLSATDPRTGTSDAGYVMASTNFFGYYAFPVLASNKTDPQIFVKVLDGRPINGKWWVFYASLTDVEFTLFVRDTQTGQTTSYHQAPYTQVSNNDTAAFSD